MDGTQMSGLPVLAETLRAANGRLIGVLTLNTEKTLNAVSLPMIEQLAEHLSAWADDERIAMVLLQGAGNKAFCAGGDLHKLYRTMQEQRDSPQSGHVTGNAYANAFFSSEYRLDYQIHTYKKPILCWGHGIVMGGGIGLMAGASHRVATEKTRLAMPEVGIGLFPDVGGSWFLNRMPGQAGRFLALTGAAIEAADARYAGLADYVLPHAARDAVLETLLAQPWGGGSEASHALVSHVLRRSEALCGEQGWSQSVPRIGPLERHRGLTDQLCGHANVEQVLDALAALDIDDPWLAKAAGAPQRASPGALRLAWRMQEAARHLCLAEVFRLEYGVALHCAAQGDFAEGIRALLIDKDMAPRWLPASSSAAFLDNPWLNEPHPLADLQ